MEYLNRYKKALKCCLKCISYYEGCSNMNASSFILFLTYMLRQNVLHFWKVPFVAFKRNTHYISRVTDAYKKATPLYGNISEANCNTRFGTCADIVTYISSADQSWDRGSRPPPPWKITGFIGFFPPPPPPPPRRMLDPPWKMLDPL